MSYEIVKAIKIDENKKEVWFKSTSSNVTPKTFNWWKSPSFSKILEEKGLIEVQKELLLQYFNGNFQKTDNNYEKSLIVFDYKKFNWDTVGEGRQFSDEEAKEALYKNYIAFCKRKKGKFVIYCKPKELFVSRFVKNGCYLVPKEDAKVFPSKEDAALKLQYFDSSKYEIWEVL